MIEYYFILVITNMNQHMMTTRSKAKDNERNIESEPLNIQPEDDIDVPY